MTFGLRYAFRQFAKTPGFAATALATLALCLGANLAIYAVVDAIIIRSLPFPEADRLLAIYNTYPGAGVDRGGASMANYFDRRASIKALSSVAVYTEGSVTVGDEGSPARVPDAAVSPEFFSTLGVPLAIGRPFTDRELTYQTDSVAILTDAYWRAHFDADPKVIGRTFLNDGLTVSVVGVLPPGFRFLSSKAQFYRPVSHDPGQRQPNSRHNNGWQMIARLAPGATLADAQAQLDAFNAVQAKDDPYAQVVRQAGYHTVAKPLQLDHVSTVRPMLLMLQCGGLLLLLIGCVNLMNLLLVRASGRAKEVAVRRALGASPLQLARDALAETTVLALVGGLLGLLVGSFGIRLLSSLGTDHLPLGATIRFDSRVAAAALIAAVVVGAVLAVPVIWLNLGTSLAHGLQVEGRSGTTSRAAQRLRHAFIVAQLALAFVLLSGAGLLGLSLQHVLETPPGFNPERVLTGQINLPWKGYKDDASHLAFVERLLPAVRALPGVSAAAISSGLPFTGSFDDSATIAEGFTPRAGDSLRAHYLAHVSGPYWSLMGIPLLEGRVLDDADIRPSQRVCVVDEAFARRYWPGVSALGRRLTMGVAFDPKDCSTVVGVVGTVKVNELAENSGHGTVYFPYYVDNPKSYNPSSFYLIVRTALEPGALAPAIQKAVLSIDPGLPINDLRPMSTRIEDSLVARRSPATLAVVFAGVALLLASIGSYGVLAYAVSQRRREIGVRMALGAQPQQVLWLFIGVGVRLLMMGLAIGIACSWAAGAAMRNLLFGVGAFDAGILAATALVLGAVVLLATYLPSSSASRVNPIEALRDE